ncbi:hypothetical protein C2S52_008203 [Perilla frutescens var. hirtella]|nr:hypothetical protein C2S52_008203 [Perilla frutescens var. hirtella]
MKKLSYLNNGEMILKYQVVSEELDALVSVKCDEDVGHMVDEMNNWENAGKPRQLRAFLFPRNPVVMEKQMGAVDPVAMEQRYLDAINGIIRFETTTTTTTSTSLICRQHPSPSPIPVRRHAAAPSFISSPRSPESCTTTADATNNYHMNSSIGRMIKMHKVKSSPNICCTNVHLHQHHVNHHQSPKPALDLHKTEKLISIRSVGHHGNGYYDKCGNHFPDTMENRAMSQVPSIARLAHSMGGATTFEKI